MGHNVHWICLRYDTPKLRPRYAQDMPKMCPRYAPDMPEICPKYTQDMPQIDLRYAPDMPMICPRYAQDIPTAIGGISSVFGGVLSVSGGMLLLGEHYHFYIDRVGTRFYWGHIITFWGRGFIGGVYHYLGARLLATLLPGSRQFF